MRRRIGLLWLLLLHLTRYLNLSQGPRSLNFKGIDPTLPQNAIPTQIPQNLAKNPAPCASDSRNSLKPTFSLSQKKNSKAILSTAGGQLCHLCEALLLPPAFLPSHGAGRAGYEALALGRDLLSTRWGEEGRGPASPNLPSPPIHQPTMQA